MIYLVEYGLDGLVGRFSGPAGFSRDDPVAAKTPRGAEAGRVMGISDGGQPDGEILRPLAEGERASPLALLAAVESAFPELIVIDGEVLLDGRTAFVQIVGSDVPEPTPLSGFYVTFQRVTAEPKGGCGSGCGSGGGCAKKDIGGPAGMPAAFAELREQMERRRLDMV